ncbi:hypothetical protein FGIG_07672 [Fasciola gigantica]|uniref:KASH domain-containing protein n=1 Tax=Fasciola gigantica TaxID=46835 RepID=A0A504ZBV1_FASGI|nr:hypothetical protein FGIG_07672 [Fasciola gigantica]
MHHLLELSSHIRIGCLSSTLNPQYHASRSHASGAQFCHARYAHRTYCVTYSHTNCLFGKQSRSPKNTSSLNGNDFFVTSSVVRAFRFIVFHCLQITGNTVIRFVLGFFFAGHCSFPVEEILSQIHQDVIFFTRQAFLSGIQACTALLEPASEGLEWDDSGDLRGLLKAFDSVRRCEEPSPPVCCSTPAQRPSNVRVDRQRHPNPKFENAGPASSESPTIPVQSIHSSRGHVLSSTAKVHPVQFGQHSQPIPGESTETIHSLFSNAPMRHGLTAQTDTSRSRGDLNVSPMSECMWIRMIAIIVCHYELTFLSDPSIYLYNFEGFHRMGTHFHFFPHIGAECSENPLAQLGLIRSRDAVPLLGLLDRLERGSAVHLSQSDLPNQPKGALETSTQELDQERVQLDIDRSFLQFYTKELKGWRELAETLRHSIIAGNSFGAHNTFTDSDPYQTQLAVDAFCDWLSVLENRVEVCLSHLNRRATWIDQLTGFSHELKSSFAVVEERVKNSLRRARDLLLTWRERCYSERAEKPCEVVLSTQSNGRSDEPVAQIDQRQMLETLDDLQSHLSPHLSSRLRVSHVSPDLEFSMEFLDIQVRLGSCHLVNDCWGSNGLFQPVPHSLREPQLSKDCVSISNDAEQISDGASFSSSFSSFLDAEVDAEPNCTESTHLRLVTERAERLQRRLRATIRRLERTVIASTGTSSVQNVPPANHSPSVAVTSNKVAHPISSTSVIPSHPLSLCLSPPSRKHAFLPKYLLFPFLTFIVLFLALLCSYYLMMGSTSRLLLMDHPFCPRLPGRVVVDFSPNWWVRMLACLQLPSAQDITW